MGKVSKFTLRSEIISYVRKYYDSKDYDKLHDSVMESAILGKYTEKPTKTDKKLFAEALSELEEESELNYFERELRVYVPNGKSLDLGESSYLGKIISLSFLSSVIVSLIGFFLKWVSGDVYLGVALSYIIFAVGNWIFSLYEGNSIILQIKEFYWKKRLSFWVIVVFEVFLLIFTFIDMQSQNNQSEEMKNDR